jgi:hypothetical protein
VPLPAHRSKIFYAIRIHNPHECGYCFSALAVLRNQMELCKSDATLILCLCITFTAPRLTLLLLLSVSRSPQAKSSIFGLEIRIGMEIMSTRMPN